MQGAGESRATRWMQAALLLALVAAPLPQASVPELPRAILTSGLCALGVAWIWQRRASAAPRSITLLLAAFVAWCAAQLLPLGLPVGESAREMLGATPAEQLSLVPARTAARTCELIALVLCFVFGASLFQRTDAAARATLVLVGLGACLSVYGILVWSGVAPPVVADLPRDVVRATYYNRNHFAGLLEMCTLAGAGLVLAHRGIRTATWHVAVASATLLCALTLVLTGSRAGIASTAAGAAVLALLWNRDRRRMLPCAVGAAAAVALVVALAAPESLAARFTDLQAEWARAGTRPDIWAGGTRLAAAFPWTGTGLGTYADVSPWTQIAAVPGRVEHAHCDPLEVLVETGILGLALLAGTTALLFAGLWRRTRAQCDRTRVGLAAGMTAGVAALVVHGAVDFNLQIPANALWCATLAGCAWSMGRTPPGTIAPNSTARSPAIRLATAAVLVVAAGEAGRIAVAATIDAQARSATNPAERHALHRRAAVIHPRAGESFVAAARALREHRPDSLRDVAQLAEAALRHNPWSPSAHQVKARAQLPAHGALAEASFRRALRNTNPHDRPRHQLDVAWSTMAAGHLGDGLAWIHALLMEHDEMAAEVVEALYQRVPSYEFIRAAVPSRPGARNALLAVLERYGDFWGREQELAARRGTTANPEHVTITEGITLVGQHISLDLDQTPRRIDVTLRFDIAAGAHADAPLVLRCESEGAAIFRSFDVRDSYAWTFELDASFPPGQYGLGLQIGPRTAPLPLARFTLDDTVLALHTDAMYGADALYLETARPGDRRGTPNALPLRPGDVLWRSVTTPDAGELLVRLDGSLRLRATLDGVPLEALHRPSSTAARFALPATPGARLELRVADDTETRIEGLLFLPESSR